MANGLLTGLLTGGLTQYLADEDASDRLKADIIDKVSTKLYNVDLPAEEKNAKAVQEVDDYFTKTYGENVASLLRSRDFFIGFPDVRLAEEKFESQLQEFGETKESYREKIDNFANKDLQSFMDTTKTTTPMQKYRSREEHINQLMKDTPYVRDLLVAPGKEQKGILGTLFGGRVTTEGSIAARGRLEQATKLPTTTEMEQPALPLEDQPKYTAGITDKDIGLVYASPQYSSNDFSRAIGERLGIAAVTDQYGNIQLDPKSQRQAEINAVKDTALSYMRMPGYKTTEGKGDINRAVMQASNDMIKFVDMPMQSNFEKYSKKPIGLEPPQGSATGVTQTLLAKAEAYDRESNTSGVTVPAGDQIIEYLIDQELSNLTNDAARNYYIQSLPTNLQLDFRTPSGGVAKADLKTKLRIRLAQR